MIRGSLHAHIGWFFQSEPPGLDDHIKDLKKSPTLRVVDAMFPLWAILARSRP